MVGAAGGSGGAELLGEVVADQRQVDLVDEAVADEGGEDAGAVLVEAEPVAFGGDQGGAAGLVGAEAGQGAGRELPGAGEEGVEAQGEGAVVDAGVVAEEPFGGGGERRVPLVPVERGAEFDGGGLGEVTGFGGVAARGGGGGEPGGDELVGGGQGVRAEGGEILVVGGSAVRRNFSSRARAAPPVTNPGRASASSSKR